MFDVLQHRSFPARFISWLGALWSTFSSTVLLSGGYWVSHQKLGRGICHQTTFHFIQPKFGEPPFDHYVNPDQQILARHSHTVEGLLHRSQLTRSRHYHPGRRHDHLHSSTSY